jgi:hypothetical protein
VAGWSLSSRARVKPWGGREVQNAEQALQSRPSPEAAEKVGVGVSQPRRRRREKRWGN